MYCSLDSSLFFVTECVISCIAENSTQKRSRVILRRAFQRILVFCPAHEPRPRAFHFVDACLDISFGDVSAVTVHHLLQAHDTDQGTKHGKLAKYPRVQEPHLKGLGGTPFLAALPVKNIGHGGHTDRRDALEGIVLDEVSRLLIGRQRRRGDESHARLQYRLAVQIVQADFVFRRRLLLFGPCDSLDVVLAFRCDFTHPVGHFLFPRQRKGKEGRHDRYCRSALSIGKLPKLRVLHCKEQTGYGGDKHEAPVEVGIVFGRRCDFVASVFWC